MVTTCAYCGVGCAFKAEIARRGTRPHGAYKDGEANRAHSFVKGALRGLCVPRRDPEAMIRPSIHQPWKEVRAGKTIGYEASEFKRIQGKYGKTAVGGITSSLVAPTRTFLVQKLIRAASATTMATLVPALPFAVTG